MKSYRVGILGAGYIADWHMKALTALPNVEVVAICDLNRKKAVEAAERYRVAHSYSNLEDMISQEKLDVIHLLLPAQAHFNSAREILERKIHLLMEKPMCVTERECQQLTTLARNNSCTLGVNHNFLFSAPYEQLLRDIQKGLLGPLNQIEIHWNKELPQFYWGPFDTWLFKRPGNVMMEVGPHSIAHLLHLMGEPQWMTAEAADPVELGSYGTGYRQWRAVAAHDGITAGLSFNFGLSFTEHTLHVKGRIATALVDFEQNSYYLQRNTRYSDPFDRYIRCRVEAAASKKQANKNLLYYALSKCGFSQNGNSFGSSICRSLTAFYKNLQGEIDLRHSPHFACKVVRWCEKLTYSAIPTFITPLSPPPVQSRTAKKSPKLLILGGTGFIGKETVRQFILEGRPVRLLCRSSSSLPQEFEHPLVEVYRGDLSNAQDIGRSMEGISTVFHLARANQATTWKDYYDQDVLMTKQVAESCLEKGVQRLFYASSIASYYSGKRAGTIDENTKIPSNIDCFNNYSKAKAISEDLLNHFYKTKNLPVTIFRPGIVIGRGASPFHWGVGMWKWNSVCKLWGKGTNPLPFVLLEDIARALIKSIDIQNLKGESFNLIGDVRLTALEYIQELQRALNTSFTVIPTPIWRFYAVDMLKWGVKCLIRYPERKRPYYFDWESRSQRAHYDNRKAKEILQWHPMQDRGLLIQKGIEIPAKDWTVCPGIAL